MTDEYEPYWNWKLKLMAMAFYIGGNLRQTYTDGNTEY
jgi:hypothetical protein